MNRKRRKALAALASTLDDVRSQLEGLRDEEGEAADLLPESLQETERADAMREAYNTLDDATSDLEAMVAALEEPA